VYDAGNLRDGLAAAGTRQARVRRHLKDGRLEYVRMARTVPTAREVAR